MSEIITLWSFQDIGALERLHSDGRLRASSTHIDEFFVPAYDWLVDQMQKRLYGYPGGYPMWAWAHKPDLRRGLHRFYGEEPQVLIGFRAKRCDVLLHDFDFWHQVLNNAPLPLTDTECEEAWDTWTREQIVASWDRIFDLERLGTGELEWIGGLCRAVQATFYEIRAEDVFQTRICQPRPCSNEGNG